MMLRQRFWNFILSRMARAHGFLDPAVLFSNLQRFSKPSEVWVPTELLRSGAVLQARGLLNSQAIQHNRDWIWPYWVQRQFDPTDRSFIPRAFNVSHINLTHRNWTALGVPDADEIPIVDPRGLVTPHTDGWSVEAWLLRADGTHVIPSLLKEAAQTMEFEKGLSVTTHCRMEGAGFVSRAQVSCEEKGPVCRVSFEASTDAPGWLAIALRPYNPEGVSFINRAELLPEGGGWLVNGKQHIHFSDRPSRAVFSNYEEGDVFSKAMGNAHDRREADCKVGMVSAAALYAVEPGKKTRVELSIPLASKKTHASCGHWNTSLQSAAQLRIPDAKFRFLYDAALRTLVLHSPDKEIYPGPYTYKRFWFRDAAFILDAMLCVNLCERAEKVLDHFPARQMPTGHFLSQDGEWDSNGQALWILNRFCRYTGRKPKPEWRGAILRGAHWIKRKRDRRHQDPLHAGLMPAGFSAEHLGPNDFYYWDDFWSIAGLQAASELMTAYGEPQAAAELDSDARDLSDHIERSLVDVRNRLGHQAVPASPTRRMDAGAIGSLACGYPLRLWEPRDERLLATARYLVDRCFLNGSFYQEISHSGLNAYLTLHVAQVLLRAGDPQFIDLAGSVAAMASPTGQWPEAVHPFTGGGCMGDGQHVWAAAEWVLMMRNMFVREEGDTLVLCSGIPAAWLKKGAKLSFGPAPTAFGDINVNIECGETPRVTWDAHWHGRMPKIEIRLPQGTRTL